jgi:hypothetical protein
VILQPENAWAELETRAQRLLEHPRDLEPRDLIRRHGSLWRLWHFPAFGAHRTWTILQPGRKAPPDALPVVREITWDRDADHRRIFDSPEASHPAQLSLRVRDAHLPPDDLQRFIEAGAKLAVPLIVLSGQVGLDGEFFGIETYEVSPFVRLQWWCAGPVEWRPLTDWVAALRSFLLAQLDRAG